MSRRQRSPKILLIDDEEQLVRALAAFLEEAGYTALTATNGIKGLTLAEHHRPDLIICDINMPALDGFQIRKQLNRNTTVAAIPFIFVTARADRMSKLNGMQAGADDYITKPFDIDELLVRVEATLRRNELSRRQGQIDASRKLNDTYREVLRNFTHELRTPLSHIKLALDLALQDKFGQAEAEQLSFLSSAARNTERLRGLIDDLLFLTALDQGGIHAFRQEINTHHHFLRPVQDVFERWGEKQLRPKVEISPDVTIYAPRDRFRQAVVHLTDNACKASPVGGSVHLSLQPNGLGGCIYTVTDEGPGIPQDQREAVFRRYYQISQGDGRRYQGLGVGLTITQAIAQTLGGNVEIVDVAQGCRVRMIIPPGQLGIPDPEPPAWERTGEQVNGGAACRNIDTPNPALP